jgi:O-antigen ligase
VGWADTQIGSVSPAIFQAHRSGPSNPVVDHLASVSDWTQDETNRDRLMAWNLSFATWGSSPIWGNGLGTTGAAALRTMPEKAFVTESQLLKSLVELGIPGVASWAILWGIILVVAYRAHRNERKVDRRWILLGILGSMLIVFIEGMVYQNLEAKQVNAIFWTLIGLLGFFAADQNKSLSD